MTKESAAQRKTRIGMLLADYDAKNREYLKLKKDVDSLKEQIKAGVPAGTYGDWIRSEGAPKEIMDQAAVKKDYTKRGVTMPTKMTDPSVIVTPKVQ